MELAFSLTAEFCPLHKNQPPGPQGPQTQPHEEEDGPEDMFPSHWLECLELRQLGSCRPQLVPPQLLPEVLRHLSQDVVYPADLGPADQALTNKSSRTHKSLPINAYYESAGRLLGGPRVFRPSIALGGVGCVLIQQKT